MRRFIAALVTSGAFAGCLFPSLDDLQRSDGGSDGASDVTAPLDVADVVQPTPDASDGGCPPNGDPTLLAYYRFDEGSGNIVKDCSGNGFDGVLLTQPDGGSWTQGHSGSAIRVDGTAGCVEIGAPPKLVLSQAITATAWVRVDQYVSLGYIVGKTKDASYFGWRIAGDTPAVITWDVPYGNLDGGGGPSASASNQPSGMWMHVAATFAANDTIALYINGSQVASSSVSSAILDDSQATVRIGCRADTSLFFVGLIDEVRIYGRALPASEIATLAAQ